MPAEHQPNYTLDEAYNLFMLDAKARRFSKRTLEWYAYHLQGFCRWILARPQPITDLHEVTSAHIRGYLIHLQERKLSSATQHNAARGLRAFFNFAVREELISDSPMRKVQMPQREKKILPALSAEDVKHLLNKCRSAREKSLVYFLLDTGVRATECCNLNVGDVDIQRGTVRVILGKGAKDRTTYLGNRAIKALVRYLVQRKRPGPKEPLFVSESGGTRLTRFGLRQALARLGRRANVEHCHPHTFRRTCALWMLRSGASIFHVQRLLGHESIDTLKQYLALVEGDAQAAHQAYGPADNMLK
jgi:site-specific recombinase XerD